MLRPLYQFTLRPCISFITTVSNFIASFQQIGQCLSISFVLTNETSRAFVCNYSTTASILRSLTLSWLHYLCSVQLMRTSASTLSRLALEPHPNKWDLTERYKLHYNCVTIATQGPHHVKTSLLQPRWNFLPHVSFHSKHYINIYTQTWETARNKLTQTRTPHHWLTWSNRGYEI